MASIALRPAWTRWFWMVGRWSDSSDGNLDFYRANSDITKYGDIIDIIHQRGQPTLHGLI